MVVEIRANSETIKKIKKVSILGSDIALTPDDSIDEAVIMLQEDGKLFVGTSGDEKVIDFAKYGYLRVLKDCPFRHGFVRTCRAEKCQLYVVHSGIGGCSLSWNALPVGR